MGIVRSLPVFVKGVVFEGKRMWRGGDIKGVVVLDQRKERVGCYYRDDGGKKQTCCKHTSITKLLQAYNVPPE